VTETAISIVYMFRKQMWTLMTQTVTKKAAELRAKTDRQLIELINRNLDRALQQKEEADCALRSASELLQVAYGATNAERRRVETKLAALQVRPSTMFASVA
jgi:regulator of sirC expression with transglutaminase-like and TPR domain